ncbi:MAG: hypothetical protein GY769_17445 [bacterium]|nr:hypothetical protein [bacterium]
MKSIRKSSRILGVIALTLVCFTFAAAPASAFFEQGIDPGTDMEKSFGSRVSMALSSLGDGFFDFLQKLGVIWAQDGARVDPCEEDGSC